MSSQFAVAAAATRFLCKVEGGGGSKRSRRRLSYRTSTHSIYSPAAASGECRGEECWQGREDCTSGEEDEEEEEAEEGR